MRLLALVTVSLLTFQETGICEEVNFVKIASWNIEHLGKRTPGQRPIGLAEHIELIGADVIALQEIYDTDGDDSTKTNESLDTAFGILNNREDRNWKYELFPKNPRSSARGRLRQLTGIAWNTKRIEKVGSTFRIEIEDDQDDDFNVWDRYPHACKFSTGENKTDFVLIPVHMKSNVDGRDFGARQRALEVEGLLAKMGEVEDQFDDRDIVILGDTNVIRASERACELLSEAGYLDLNASDLPTYVGRRSPFDRFFVPRSQWSSEFRYARQYALVASDSEAHDEYLSDHFAVVTVFRVRDDDD